jgi:LysM repeat protein
MNHRLMHRRWPFLTVLLLAVGAVGLVGCQSNPNPGGTPQTQLSGTAIPMMTIVTPTPGLPPAAGVTVTAVPTGAAQQSANGSYTVQPGDTLYDIAVKFNVTVDALMQANSITDPSQLQVNEVLVIPQK